MQIPAIWHLFSRNFSYIELVKLDDEKYSKIFPFSISSAIKYDEKCLRKKKSYINVYAICVLRIYGESNGVLI